MDKFCNKSGTVNNWSYDSVAVCAKNRYIKAYYHKIEVLDYHTHDFYELNIVTDGSGIHRIGERELPSETGDVFVIPPTVGHGYRSSDSITVFHLLLSNRFMDSFGSLFDKLSGYRMLFSIEPELRLRTEFSCYLKAGKFSLDKLWSSISALVEKSDCRNEREELDSAFLAGLLISFLADAMSAPVSYSEGRNAKKRTLSVIGAMEYLYNHSDEPLDTAALAEKCCMSYSSFLRAFKRISGATPSEYVAASRIQRAKALLSNGSLSVLEIAMSLGYYDSAHFIREFERRAGYTPSEYRKRFSQPK
jgi:AraC-like DNA-binding protein